VCYWDEASGALFAGDAVLPHSNKLGAVLSKPDPVCGGRMQDKVASLRKLLHYPLRHLFSGHGEPVFHKGSDHLKIALYTLHKSFHEDQPALAWAAVGNDLLDAGQAGEARQCAAKARDLDPGCAELKDLEQRIAGAAHGQG
jgi:glyoxylase-like metal-dependent hydrolase (beta-lactamase superfamily II)